MAEKTSLQKSHSVWSNTKLTTLCIVASLFVSAFWGVLALYNVLNQASSILFYALLALTCLGSVLCLVLFNKFKR